MKKTVSFLGRHSTVPRSIDRVSSIFHEAWLNQINPWFSAIGANDLEVPWPGENLFAFSIDTLMEHQRGYGVSGDGTRALQEWPQELIVIASCLSDPVCVDKAAPERGVLFSRHGTGRWDFRRIASTLEEFDTAVCTVLDVYKNAYSQNPWSNNGTINQDFLFRVNSELRSILPQEVLTNFLSIVAE